MRTPALCIRNRPSTQKYGGRKYAGRCIETGGLAELMGTERGAFLLRGSHLHNGKVEGVGVGAGSPPSGGDSRRSGRTERRYRGARRGRCRPPSCPPPVSSARRFSNHLCEAGVRRVLVNLIFKRLQRSCPPPPSLHCLYSANEQQFPVDSPG